MNMVEDFIEKAHQEGKKLDHLFSSQDEQPELLPARAGENLVKMARNQSKCS